MKNGLRLIAEFHQTPWALLPETLAALQAVLSRWAAGARLSAEEIRAAIGDAPEITAARRARWRACSLRAVAAYLLKAAGPGTPSALTGRLSASRPGRSGGPGTPQETSCSTPVGGEPPGWGSASRTFELIVNQAKMPPTAASAAQVSIATLKPSVMLAG